jgi:hypothetical protein
MMIEVARKRLLNGRLTLVNVWQDTALGDCDVTEKFIQLLIVSDGKLEMTRDDTGLLVVAGSVASQFEDFSCEIFEDGCEVDGSTSTDTLGIVAFPQQTVDTTNGKGETSFRRATAARDVSFEKRPFWSKFPRRLTTGSSCPSWTCHLIYLQTF